MFLPQQLVFVTALGGVLPHCKMLVTAGRALGRDRAIVCAVGMWLALCAIGCGANGNDAHAGARARPTGPQALLDSGIGEPSLQPRAARKKRPDDPPTLEGTQCAVFLPFLPLTFEGYRAKAPAEGKDIDLGEGAGLVVLKRGYFKTGTALDIEIVDTEKSKALRALFDETRELERDNDSAVIKPIRVQGHKALAQWNSTGKASRVTVLVEGRFLVNLSLRPTDGVAASVALAEKLELADLAKLQTGNEIAAH